MRTCVNGNWTLKYIFEYIHFKKYRFKNLLDRLLFLNSVIMLLDLNDA